jgi:OFA family oxalate/formate antiporter-like MFS transporter
MVSSSPQGQAGSVPWEKVPIQGWITVLAGISINLCLGVLYAWSVFKAALLANKDHIAGSLLGGINAGWTYMSDTQTTWAYSICGFVFCAFMIPGGRIQDKLGPRVSVTVGGLSLALGCIIAGYMRSYVGLVIGFGFFCGIGMGIGYSGPIPAAVKWFSAHRRGLVVGFVVGGFGAAAIYLSAVAAWLMKSYGISNSFYIIGIFFSIVAIVAGRLLYSPPEGYVPPAAPAKTKAAMTAQTTSEDWTASEMLKTGQYIVLVIMAASGAQAGLLVIVNAAPLLFKTAHSLAFFVANAWMLASYASVMNLCGRVGTGFYSDKIGRKNAFVLNALLCVLCLFLLPYIIKSGNVFILFLTVGIACWQFGGQLALMPAIVADYFGAKNLGFNYGLVFALGGICFFVPEIAAFIKDTTGSMDYAFYMSGIFLAVGIVACILIRKPVKVKAKAVSPAIGA